MDTGPSYSYLHDLKYTKPVNGKGKGVCMVQTYFHLLCLYNS